MAYDFTKLTPAQKELLSFGGWHVGSMLSQPWPRTVQKLIDRGLLIATKRLSEQGRFRVEFTEYIVPLPVHMAWCDYCAKHFKAE